MNKSVTKTIAFFGIVSALFLFVISSTHCYYRKQSFGGVKALWDTNDTYLFFQIDSTAEKLPLWEVLLTKLTKVWRYNSQISQKDISVFHIRDNTVTPYSQGHFDFTGQLFWFQDAPCLIQGGDSVKGYKWESNQFTILNPDDLEHAQAQLRLSVKNSANIPQPKLDWEQTGAIGENYDKEFAIGPRLAHMKLRIKLGASQTDAKGYVIRNPTFEAQLLTNGDVGSLLRLSQDYNPISAKEFESFSHGNRKNQ